MSEAAGMIRDDMVKVEDQPAARGRAMKLSRRLVVCAILALTFTAYVGTLGYQFVYDDRSQITNNRLIQSWANVPQYFTGHSWKHLYPNLLGNYYRPV